MKDKKFLVEIADLSEGDLKKKLLKLEEDYFKLKCKKVLGQVEDTSALKKHRRNIARVKTLITRGASS